MAAPKTVDNLLAELRSLLDEENEEALDDSRDLLPALNRAQSYAYNILARRYEDPLLKYVDLTLTSTDQEYDIPEDAFEDRLVKVEINIEQGNFCEVQRISYKDITKWEMGSPSPTPNYYCVIGRKIRLVPQPTGQYSARIWYIQDPEKMVTQQGRLTTINTLGNYIRVDSVGTGITTEVDSLDSYVNLVDGQTGLIKASLQVQSFDTSKITFKTTPSRSTVQNKSITGDLSSVTELSLDDYICLIHGTCVTYFQDALDNFVLQYAAHQMQQKLGTNTGLEQQLVDKFEKQLERQWTNREQQIRVGKDNKIFSRQNRIGRRRFS